MARKKDEGVGHFEPDCNWCNPEFCKGYVNRYLRFKRDDPGLPGKYATALRMHHYLTMPSQTEMAGHLRESYGYEAKDETGIVKSWCEWYRTMHDLWAGKVDNEGRPLSTADTWLGEKLVKALKLGRHKSGVVTVPGHRFPTEIEDPAMF